MYFTYKRLQSKSELLLLALRPLLATLLAATVATASTAAMAQESEASAEVANPALMINVNGQPLEKTLRQICTKAGWGLVLNLPDDMLKREVTVMLPSPKPARQVVNMVIANLDLEANYHSDVLTITPKKPPISVKPMPVSPPEAAPNADSDNATYDSFHDVPQKLKLKMKEKVQKFHDKKLKGTKSNERVSLGEPVVIEKDETVSEAVSIGDRTTVLGRVKNDAVSVGKELIIGEGAYVGNDAVCVGGNVIIKKGAVVEGEAVAVGGKVIADNSAIIEGGKKSINVKIPFIELASAAAGMGVFFWIIMAVVKSLMLLLIGLLVIWAMPEKMNTMQQYLRKRPGKSFLFGLLTFLAFVPVIVILALTIIGIPLIPIAVIGLILLVILGLVVFMSWLGNIIPLFKSKKGKYGALFLGFLVFMLLHAIPGIGMAFLVIASIAAVGAVILSKAGSRSA